MRYLISALFALMVPILSVVALAIALSNGESGVISLLAAVVGYGLLTEWHVRRRANASSLLETPTPGWLLQLLNLVTSHGELEFAISGRIRWSPPSGGFAEDSGPNSGVHGKVGVHVRGSHRLSSQSSMLAAPEVSPVRDFPPLTPAEPPRVLIVSNDERYLGLVAELLRIHGNYVIASSDCDGALDIVEHECPGFVVLDLDSEGSMTGGTILELLSLAPSTTNVPIIGLTWNTARIRSSHGGLKEQRIPILRKPFVPADLYELVDAATASGDGVKPRVDWHWSFESPP
jgi:CheY-like chemotaxis protein